MHTPTICALILAAVVTGALSAADTPAAETPKAAGTRTVEVGCAACIYAMPGISGCKELAAVVDGKPMLVSGSDLKIHTAGLCESKKNADVVGEVKDGKLVVTKLQLKP